MDEDVSELKPLLTLLLGKVDQVIATQTLHSERLTAIEHEQGRLATEHERFAKELARLAREQQRVAEELARLAKEQQRLATEQARVAEELARLAAEQVRLATEQVRLTKEQERIKEAQFTNNGQMSVMLQWLQSMDQRFGALMAPVTPPRQAKGA